MMLKRFPTLDVASGVDSSADRRLATGGKSPSHERTGPKSDEGLPLVPGKPDLLEPRLQPMYESPTIRSERGRT